MPEAKTAPTNVQSVVFKDCASTNRNTSVNKIQTFSFTLINVTCSQVNITMAYDS